MSIIVNGVTIPVTGDFIFSNNANIDTVVANGVTVWEKRKSVVLYDHRAYYDGRASYPYANSNSYYYGDVPSANNNWKPPAPYLAVSNADNGSEDELFFSSLAHPYKDARYGSLGNTDYRNAYDPGISEEECRAKYWTGNYGTYGTDTTTVYMRPSKAMYNLQNVDCTNYDYLIVSAIGEITSTPSGNMHNATEIILGLDYYGRKTADRSLLYKGCYNGDENDVHLWGNMVNFKGHGHDNHTNLGTAADKNHKLGWTTVALDIRNVTGIHPIKCLLTGGSYTRNGWLRIAFIGMCSGDPSNMGIDLNWPY